MQCLQTASTCYLKTSTALRLSVSPSLLQFPHQRLSHTLLLPPTLCTPPRPLAEYRRLCDCPKTGPPCFLPERRTRRNPHLLNELQVRTIAPAVHIHHEQELALRPLQPTSDRAGSLQAYCSGLIFAPAKSIIRKRFEGRIPGWMRKLSGVSENWSALLQTLEGHASIVTSVAFSRRRDAGVGFEGQDAQAMGRRYRR
jgi:hypothetical protein